MKHITYIALGTLLLASSTMADTAATTSVSEPAGEEYHYRWHLGSLFGRVAGLFLPSRGDGVLSFRPTDDGRLRSDLLITSEQSRDDEFWRYGSEIDPSTGHTRRAWSSYRWRGKEKERDEEIDRDDVRDVVSGIWAIRRDPPKATQRMEIWSDGKIYPVVVVPRGTETRRVGPREVETRRYIIRGYSTDRTKANGQRHWKGSLELWLTTDPAATPVEIRISRNLADLRLRLVALPGN